MGKRGRPYNKVTEGTVRQNNLNRVCQWSSVGGLEVPKGASERAITKRLAVMSGITTGTEGFPEELYSGDGTL